jgi:uncharacterized protein (TIGR00299 family) protein
MRTLYLDLVSGISGDMFLAALLDLGLPLPVLEEGWKKLGLPEPWHVHVRRASRASLAGAHLRIHLHHHAHEDHGPHHHHPHDHGHSHVHGRTWKEIRALIEDSPLSAGVKRDALGIFGKVAEAEARIHGVPVEEVHFHEVGATDSILDIVGAALAVEALGIGRILASPPVEGTGTIECAHGAYPLPAPATLEILKGVPLSQCALPHELITPTGAAILAWYAQSYGPLKNFAVEKTGYGLGTRDLGSHPNVLRALLGETQSAPALADFEQDEIVQITTNLDDLSGELVAPVIDRLLEAGAHDVCLFPIQMKKGRPAWQLQVLADEARLGALAELLFTHTSAFGLRHERLPRLKLRREFKTAATPHGPVQVKLGWLGDRLLQRAPEFESCRALAEKTNLPLAQIYQAAQSAPLA